MRERVANESQYLLLLMVETRLLTLAIPMCDIMIYCHMPVASVVHTGDRLGKISCQRLIDINTVKATKTNTVLMRAVIKRIKEPTV